jgi:hypothetical protein
MSDYSIYREKKLSLELQEQNLDRVKMYLLLRGLCKCFRFTKVHGNSTQITVKDVQTISKQYLSHHVMMKALAKTT